MKRNNKALYELIMRNVSHEVKRALNESMINDIPTYSVSSVECTTVEDNWEEGEEPETSQSWIDKIRFCDKSIKDLVKRVADYYSLDIENAIVYDDTIMINGIVDVDNTPLSQYQEEQWRAGEITAYSFDIRFSIVKEEGILHDELVAQGFESYD